MILENHDLFLILRNDMNGVLNAAKASMSGMQDLEIKRRDLFSQVA